MKLPRIAVSVLPALVMMPNALAETTLPCTGSSPPIRALAPRIMIARLALPRLVPLASRPM